MYDSELTENVEYYSVKIHEPKRVLNFKFLWKSTRWICVVDGIPYSVEHLMRFLKNV